MAKYSKKTVERICTLMSTDSYTIAEICQQVGISERTYYDWLSKNADFADAIEKAQDNFNELMKVEAKKSLIKLVKGFTVQEKRTVTADTGKKDENGKPIVRVKEHAVIDKHYPPNTAAVIFTLANRDPDNWKNRQDNKTELDATVKTKPISRDLANKILEQLEDGE